MNKRLICFFLCVILLLGIILPVCAEDAEPAAEVSTLSISTPEGFLEFAENCRLDTYSQNLLVSLEQDIDLTGLDFTGIPIFSGTFDGKNHLITGLSLSGEGSMQGLFRCLTADAVVKDLSVFGELHPGGSRNQIGGIAGINEGQILNCSFSGSISGSDSVGGIAGINALTGILDHCQVSGDIHGDHFVGGIAGENTGVIRSCSNRALINTTPQQNSVEISDITLDTLTNTEAANTVTDIGGIVGISSGVVRNCDNRGDVGYPHMGYNIGGIAGTQSGYLADCENHAHIQGRKEVGGIVGQMEPSTLIEYTEDTLQILQDQLGTMSGMVNRASTNAQSNASQIGGQISILQEQAQTARDAVGTLFPNASSPELPDADTILAAQNTLSATMNAMPATMQSIADAAQTTASGLTRDLRAISGQISAMGQTINNAAEHLGGTITDISDDDTPELLTGKVENCANHGPVLAELNVGGIAGAIAMENDLDILEDWQQIGEESLDFHSQIRAVILDCENSGTVTGTKQNVGGIVGSQIFGLVKNTANTGKVDGTNADYVGGIAGMSTGFLRSDWVKAEICGNTYVGGIAGSATIVTQSLAQTRLFGAQEYQGAVLGIAEPCQTDEEQPIAENYYLRVDTDPGAIDGISYAGLAEPKSFDAFLQMENLPRMFQTVSLRFLLEDGRMMSFSVEPGGAFDPDKIPSVPQREGYNGKWFGLEEANLQKVLFDMTFEAVYTAYSTVIQTGQTRENGLPILLVEGSFTDQATVSIQKSTDVPGLGAQESVLESWTISMNETAHTARLLLPEGANAERIKLYVSGPDGVWQECAFHMEGSYLVFPVTSDSVHAVLVQQQTDYTVFLLIGIIVLLLIAVIVHRSRKRRKSKVINKTEDQA